MSEAFGTFDTNFTLLQTVCRSCNQHFGDNLERIFARDSFEAFDRIKHGLKPSREIAGLPQDRLTFTVALTGEWYGLRLRLVVSDGSKAVEPVPQVGLPKKGDRGWTYLTEAELADTKRNLPSECDSQGQVRIVAPSARVQQRLIGLLSERGITFREKGLFPPPNLDLGEIEIYVNHKIDPVVKRCIAKIVFNYLAHATSREFALHPTFDMTRSYIRYGGSPGYPIVLADDRPILADDRRTLRQTDGHLVTINWTADRRHVVGQLSLFNRVTYRVSLAQNFSGLWRQIRSGHHFDLGTRRISPLTVTSLHVPFAGAH